MTTSIREPVRDWNDIPTFGWPDYLVSGASSGPEGPKIDIVNSKIAMNSLRSTSGVSVTPGKFNRNAKKASKLDQIVLGVMLCASAAIGIYYACTGGKQKTAGEFLLGDRQMQTFPVAMSLLASFLSSVTLLGIPAEVYMNGAGYWYITLSFCIVIPMVVFIYMPLFYNLGFTSVFMYLEKRFCRTLRIYACILFSINMMVYLAVVLYGPAIALSAVTRIPTWACILIVGSICTFYTSVGGVKAVVWTDTMQLVLMFGGSVTALGMGIYKAGGLTEIVQTAHRSGRFADLYNFSADPTQRHTVWSVIIGGIFFWTSAYGVNQVQVQRYLSIPSLKQAQTCLWIGLPGFLILLTVTTWTGLALYAYYQHCDPLWQGLISAPDQILPMFALETLGHYPGLPGLFVVGIFSGSLSTISSGVNSLAAIFLEDCCKLIKPNMGEDMQARMSKLAAVTFGFFIIACAFAVGLFGQVLEFAYALFGMISGPLLGVFVAGMFFPWTNSKGAFIGLTTGLVLTLWIGIGAKVSGPTYAQPVRGLSNESFCPPVRPHPLIINVDEKNEDILDVYKMSYMWYGPFGCATVVVVALLTSFAIDRRGREIDPTLMQPIFWKMAFFLPPRHREKLLFGMPHERTPEHLPTKVAKKHPEQHASVATVVMELENGRAAPSPAPTIEYEISVL